MQVEAAGEFDWWVVVHREAPSYAVDRFDVLGFESYREALAAFGLVAPAAVHIGLVADQPLPPWAPGVLSASLLDFTGRIVLGGAESNSNGTLEFWPDVVRPWSLRPGSHEIRFEEDLLRAEVRLVGPAQLPVPRPAVARG